MPARTGQTGQVVAPSGAYFVARRCAYWQLVVDGDGDCGNGDGKGDGDGDRDDDVDVDDNARDR